MDLGSTQQVNLELKKHVNAIHCSNNLSLVQRKLFNALLFNAYSELPYKSRFQIHTKELCRLIGYNSNDYNKLKNSLLALVSIAIEWNVLDTLTGQEQRWKASSILAAAELADGVCQYEYSQVMKDLLYQPEIYGRINIELVAKFNSGYGLALYENCIRYQGLPQTPWFTLGSFRKLMGINEDKYLAFKDLKKRVLNIAVEEVNSISPLAVEPEIERQNQKVIKLRFKLSKKLSNANDKLVENSAMDDELESVLRKTFKLSAPIINDIFQKYEADFIKEKIQLIMQSENFRAGKIRGLAGYMVEALKKDYQPSQSSKAIVSQQQTQKELEEKTQKMRVEKRQTRYSQYINNKISEYLSSLVTEDHQKLINEFEDYARHENPLLLKWYNKHKLEHPGAKACFYDYIRSTQQQLKSLLSLKEFVALIDECE